MPRRRRPPRPGALADLAPLRIATQIVVLQLLYYLSAGILILFTALVAGAPIRLELLFSWKSLRGDVTIGWMLGVVWMLNSLIAYASSRPSTSSPPPPALLPKLTLQYSVIPLLLLIARSKLIPDFALTIHFIHLITTSLYTKALPSHWFWWALQLCSAALMTSLGVWSCQWRELRPISFGGSKPSNTSSTEHLNSNDMTTEDGGAGFSRGGRGRGRGRDGQGQYEMVGMGANDEHV